MFRDRREGREQGEGLKMQNLARMAHYLRAVGVTDRYAVCEENHVEFGALGGLSQLPILGEVQTIFGPRIRMPPGCYMMTRIL